MRYFLLSGRFWAEEGHVFFRDLYGLSFFEALSYVSPRHGQYFLGINLSVYLATLVPFEYAPLVTTYFALVIQAIIVVLLLGYRDQLKINSLSLAALMVIITAIPQSDEVWASSTNMHWHMQVILVLILIVSPSTKRARWMIAVLLILCGLTSLSIVFVLPLFLAKAFLTRDKDDLNHAAIAAATSLLQLAVFFSTPSTREVAFSPAVLFFAVANQQFVHPLLGTEAARTVVDVYTQQVADLQFVGILILMLTAIGISAVYYFLFRNGNARIKWMIAAMGFIVVGNVMETLETDVGLMSPFSGTRYFYAPNVLFFTAVAAVAGEKKLILSPYLTVVASVGLVSLFAPQIIWSPQLTGPNWRQSLERARAWHLMEVEIWPSYPWRVPNVELLGEGYSFQWDTYEFPRQAYEDCQQECTLIYFSSNQETDFWGRPLAGVESAGEYVVIVSSGEVVYEYGGQQPASMTYSTGTFEVLISNEPPRLTLNSIPVPLDAGTAHILMLDNHTRTITAQSFAK